VPRPRLSVDAAVVHRRRVRARRQHNRDATHARRGRHRRRPARSSGIFRLAEGSVLMKVVAGIVFAAAAAVAAQSTHPRVDAHVAAARAAAGEGFAGVFNRICRGAVPPAAPANPAPARGAAPRPAGPPARETWHAEPVKVFDNLYFLGQTEYSVWAVTTSEG